MDIRVITVTYNSADCISDCIESVLNQTGVQLEMFVVDNASHDGTAERVNNFAGRVQFLKNSENIGFGAACNQGAEGATSEFLYFLNPDAKLASPTALKDLANKMGQHPSWGLCGTKTAGQIGMLYETSYPGERHLKHPLPPLPGRIAWVVGATMFFRRDVFEQIGGFDERIFLYAEEIDICLRLRKAGFEIGMASEVVIDHVGGASGNPSDLEATWKRKMTGLSQFYRNHYQAGDIIRLWRRDLRRARWRLFLNRVFGTPRPRKAAQYTAIRDVAIEQLQMLKG